MGDLSDEEAQKLIDAQKTKESEAAEKEKGHVLDQLQARIKDPKNNK
jgi:hypothetical protein